LEFRLTYDGPLLASNAARDTRPARKEHKHKIRKRFHSQLKTLWSATPHLQTGHGIGEHIIWGATGVRSLRYDAETLSNRYNKYGWNFVPLVTEELRLSCWVDILFLRMQPPGSLFSMKGDIDNRLKTLLDCLQIPDANQNYQSATPEDHERPFFCLLENDRMISKISVETDALLEDLKENQDENYSRLVITVRLRPYEMTFLNIQFG
jgi:hypothetical protein